MTLSPLDSLSDEAISLVFFLRRRPLRWFVDGSESARHAKELAAAGHPRLRVTYDGPVRLLMVVVDDDNESEVAA